MTASAARRLAPRPAEPVTPSPVIRPQRHLQLVPPGVEVAADHRGARLTRRGRLTVTMFVVAALVAVGLMFSASTSPSLRIDHTTSVRSGQTLSEVAVEQLPSLPISQAVTQIQIVNDLDSLHVHAGQLLRIPLAP